MPARDAGFTVEDICMLSELWAPADFSLCIFLSIDHIGIVCSRNFKRGGGPLRGEDNVLTDGPGLFSGRKDRGSTTSLGSDFSLVMESSPGAAGSFTYETVELVPAGAQTQAAW